MRAMQPSSLRQVVTKHGDIREIYKKNVDSEATGPTAGRLATESPEERV